MKSTPKWLLIPPAVAALLILGPLSMQGNQDTAAEPTTPPVSATTSEPTGQPLPKTSRESRTGSLVPRTPDMWKMGSTLIGVLLLGVGGVMVLRRLRGGAVPSGTAKLVSVRQTVRLSQRQALHVVEFDNRILLVGEHERGLALLDSSRGPESTTDEAEVLSRPAVDDLDDEGAVPKNLLIPRPDHAPRRVPAKQPAQLPAGARLNDFRSLLQKAGR